MRDPDGFESGSENPLVAKLERVVAEVAAVREEVRSLRAEQAESVRTRRLVVVDADGFERVVVAGRGHHGHITLSGRAPDGHSVCAELFANDPIDDAGAHVGVALSDDGNVVAGFEVVQGRRPAMWVEGVEAEGGGAAN